MIGMNIEQEAQESTALIPKMDEQTRVRYAAKVKRARQELGMTQAEVAEAAGVSRNTVMNLESGRQIPQTEKLWSVLLVVGIRPELGEPEWIDQWLAVLVPLFKRVPEEARGRTLGEVTRVVYDAINAR